MCRDGNRLLIRRDIGCAERVLAAEIAPCFHRRRKRQFTAEAFVRIIDDGHIDFVAVDFKVELRIEVSDLKDVFKRLAEVAIFKAENAFCIG